MLILDGEKLNQYLCKFTCHVLCAVEDKLWSLTQSIEQDGDEIDCSLEEDPLACQVVIVNIDELNEFLEDLAALLENCHPKRLNVGPESWYNGLETLKEADDHMLFS